MKTVAAIAIAAFVAGASAQWEDKPVDPAKSTTTTAAQTTWLDYDPKKTTTTTKPVASTEAYWGDEDPSKKTTTTTAASSSWADYDPSKTSSKPVKATTTTTTHWDDWTASTTTTKPVKVSSSTTTPAWSDWSASTTSTKPVKVVTTTKAPAPTSQWVDAGVGSCKVVTVTKTGSWIWVPAPADPTWQDVADKTTSTTKVIKATTTTEAWTDYDPKTTTKSVKASTTTTPVWSDWTASTSTTKPVKPTSSSTTSAVWSDYDPTTTTKSVKPTSSSTSAVWEDVTTTTTTSYAPKPTWTTSTTTAAPAPTGAVCPNDNGKTLPASGSCGGSFQVNCGAKASPGAGSKFWQRNQGETISTLAECISICNDNSACEAVLYVNGMPGNGDNEICWQTSGLGPVTGTNYAQIAYKSGASGNCKANYSS